MIIEWLNQAFVLIKQNTLVDQRFERYGSLNKLEKACKDQMKKVFKRFPYTDRSSCPQRITRI